MLASAFLSFAHGRKTNISTIYQHKVFSIAYGFKLKSIMIKSISGNQNVVHAQNYGFDGNNYFRELIKGLLYFKLFVGSIHNKH